MYSKKFGKFAGYLALLLVAISFMAPFFWMLSTSLKYEKDVFKDPPEWIPSRVRWENFKDVFQVIPYFTYLKNTVFIATLATVGTLISSSMAAYSFSIINWKGGKYLFFIALMTMMIPPMAIMIPLYLVYRTLGLVNTFIPLILPACIGVPYHIFILRQFFRGVPKELREAAHIDGANEFQIYYKIYLPLAKPSLSAVAIFQFFASWSDFMGPLIYLNDQMKYTLALGIQQFQGQHQSQWALFMAAAFIMIVPPMIFFYYSQKNFIKGITISGLKG